MRWIVDIKQVLYSGPTNITHRRIKFSGTGGIRAPLIIYYNYCYYY